MEVSGNRDTPHRIHGQPLVFNLGLCNGDFSPYLVLSSTPSSFNTFVIFPSSAQSSPEEEQRSPRELEFSLVRTFPPLKHTSLLTIATLFISATPVILTTSQAHPGCQWDPRLCLEALCSLAPRSLGSTLSFNSTYDFTIYDIIYYFT